MRGCVRFPLLPVNPNTIGQLKSRWHHEKSTCHTFQWQLCNQRLINNNSSKLNLMTRLVLVTCGVEITDGSIKLYRKSMHGTEPEIDSNRLPVSHTERLPKVYNVSFPKISMQCPWHFPGCMGPLGLRTGSRIISTGITGDISSESWRNTPPLFLSVTDAEARSPCGGLPAATTSRRSFGLERWYGFGERPYSTDLSQVGYPFKLMQSRYNLREPFRTLAVPSHITAAIGWPSTTACVRFSDGGGLYPR